MESILVFFSLVAVVGTSVYVGERWLMARYQRRLARRLEGMEARTRVDEVALRAHKAEARRRVDESAREIAEMGRRHRERWIAEGLRLEREAEARQKAEARA